MTKAALHPVVEEVLSDGSDGCCDSEAEELFGPGPITGELALPFEAFDIHL